MVASDQPRLETSDTYVYRCLGLRGKAQRDDKDRRNEMVVEEEIREKYRSE